MGQGYSHRFLILQVLTFKCRAGSTFCRGTTLPAPDSSSPKLVPKQNMHLKHTGPTKNHTSLLAQHHNTFPKKAFQWAKAIHIGSWFYRCWHLSVVQVPHFAEAPPSQLQTPAAQNLFQNKHAPEAHWTNKKPYVPASTTSQYIPQKSVSVGQGYSHRFLILQVLTFKCRAGSTFCRGTTLPAPDSSSPKLVPKQTCTWSTLDQQKTIRPC